jgi:hypothetical protein
MTNNPTNSVDVERLRALYKSNPVAKAGFDYFASRRRGSRVTTVVRLQGVLEGQGHRVSYGETKGLLQILADMHCGDYVIGRRGKPSRLVWHVNLMTVGQAASGKTTQIEKVEDSEDAVELPETPQSNNAIKVSYPLRHDWYVEVILPKDFSAREAFRLAEFIKTLPFGSEQVAA